jgi:hypothetical protein
VTDEAQPPQPDPAPAPDQAPKPEAVTPPPPKKKNKPGAGAPKKITRKIKEQIVTMLAHGLTEERIAEILNLSKVTIWKTKQDREFVNAVLFTKDAADNEVVKSLYLRAVGYTHQEEKVFCHNGKIVTYMSRKHYPPDTGAITLWLINRKRAEWRKEIQKEENREKENPMIRLLSRITGEEAARVRQVGNQTSVLLGDDFVAEILGDGQNGQQPPNSAGNGHP